MPSEPVVSKARRPLPLLTAGTLGQDSTRYSGLKTRSYALYTGAL